MASMTQYRWWRQSFHTKFLVDNSNIFLDITVNFIFWIWRCGKLDPFLVLSSEVLISERTSAKSQFCGKVTSKNCQTGERAVEREQSANRNVILMDKNARHLYYTLCFIPIDQTMEKLHIYQRKFFYVFLSKRSVISLVFYF